MLEEHLTVDQCDELAKAPREDAVRLTHGSERENLLQLAEGYRVLRHTLCATSGLMHRSNSVSIHE
jgi:hypothetical protein